MKKHPFLLLRFSLFLLIIALFVGVLTSFAYFDKGIWGEFFTFQRLRPLHVSSALFWILSAAQGCVSYFVHAHFKTNNRPQIWIKLSQGTWMISLVLALFCLLFGHYGGREYWEYPPIINLPILLSWLFFAIHLYSIVFSPIKKQPVFVWMWCTGTLFFILSLIEGNLWLLPWFRENIVRDLTIQWKSNGALVGAWNQLIYGCAFYLMTRIAGNKKVAFSWQAFFFYFLGMANLMFNWGHHTYNVPAAAWVRNAAYLVSMTEWVFLLNILYSFRKKLSAAKKQANWVSYRFLYAAEAWVLLNLLLALAMSIPGIHRYTHGTHIVVAHAMGTTVGINSMILFGAIFYIAEQIREKAIRQNSKYLHFGFWLANGSLLIFWISLIAAGIVKAHLMVSEEQSFQITITEVQSYLIPFVIAGIGLCIGLSICAIFLFRLLGPRKRKV